MFHHDNSFLSQALLGLPPLVTECTNLEASLTAREDSQPLLSLTAREDSQPLLSLTAREDSQPLLSLKPRLPLLVQPFTTLCRARHQGDTVESDKMVNTVHVFFVP